MAVGQTHVAASDEGAEVCLGETAGVREPTTCTATVLLTRFEDGACAVAENPMLSRYIRRVHTSNWFRPAALAIVHTRRQSMRGRGDLPGPLLRLYSFRIVRPPVCQEGSDGKAIAAGGHSVRNVLGLSQRRPVASTVAATERPVSRVDA